MKPQALIAALLVPAIFLYGCKRYAPAVSEPEALAAGPAQPADAGAWRKSPANTPALSINFGPYIRGLNPERGDKVFDDVFREILDLISPVADTIRTFAVDGDMSRLYAIAKQEYNMRIIAGCWLGAGYSQKQIGGQLSALTALGNASLADVLLVGSETVHRGEYSQEQIISYINTVRGGLKPGINIPVGTSDTLEAYTEDLTGACDVICVTYYPYWNGVDAFYTGEDLKAMTLSLKARADGKEIIITETGFPDQGAANGKAVPGMGNARLAFEEAYRFSREYDIEICFFEAVDEAWKGSGPDDPEAHWGFFNDAGEIKPAYADIFESIAAGLAARSANTR
ncbi:MAG: hypothetical protein LBB94_01055 [Clostridiales bacterium]|jgi:exo-beta-1,3-glucanase (GH17 family)|nr:hypothetical protein [Clostridiales bacterium]